MSEASFINKIIKLFPNNTIGDDCAIIPAKNIFPQNNETGSNDYLLITTDTLVENVHFSLTYFSLEEVGYRSLAVNLSDIAACGGMPFYFSMSITIPPYLNESDLLKIYSGFQPLVEQYSLILTGGDIVSGEKLSVTMTLFGTTQTPLSRTGAKEKDYVYVTGTLGGASYALSRYLSGETPSSSLADRHKKPVPRVELIKSILEKYSITSCIDISDGFSLDLSRLQTGNIGFEIDYFQLPVHPELTQLSAEERDLFFLYGGEDFELIFTSPEKIKAENVTQIGVVTCTKKIELVYHEKKVALEPRGYDHFNRS